MKISLVLINNKTFDFTNLPLVCVIGRSSKCDVVVPDDGVSRQHCKVEVIDGNVFLTDLDSTNGVYISGEKIPPMTPTLYFTSLPLSFGSVQSAQIFLDQTTINLKAPSKPKAENDHETLTKTKTVPSQHKKTDSSKNSAPKKSSGSKNSTSLLVTLIVVLVLGLGVYFYMNSQAQNESAEISTEADSIDIN